MSFIYLSTTAVGSFLFPSQSTKHVHETLMSQREIPRADTDEVDVASMSLPTFVTPQQTCTFSA